MDIHLSPTALTAIPRNHPAPSDAAVIPETETFHSALKSASDTPEKLSGVAKQFEALMIEQMLKSGRADSGGGWFGSDDDQDDHTGSLVMEMAEQSFSQALAARGGMGIAKMVTANLEGRESIGDSGPSKTASSDSQDPPSARNTDFQRR